MNAVLIAPLGDEAQEISLTTQLLLEQDEMLTHVVVLCYLPDKHPIQQSFDGQSQWPTLVFRGIPFSSRFEPTQFDSFTDALFTEIKQWLSKTYRIHLLLSGECKAMNILAMSVAQLLLGSDDHVWYLYQADVLRASGQLLKFDHDQVKLIEMRFPNLVPIAVRFTRLMEANSLKDAYQTLADEQKRRLRYFVEQVLTPKELQVAILLAKNMSNADIAAHLVTEEKTIKNHITRINKKLEEQFALPSKPQLKREFLQQNFCKWLDIL